MFLPGQLVYIEFPLPLVDRASPARVGKKQTIKTVELVCGEQSGMWPKSLVGKTREEAEEKCLVYDKARLNDAR